MKKKEMIALFKDLTDKEVLRSASSLSYHTILSIIPILLISLSIFTKLPSFETYYSKIKEFIFSSLLPSHQDAFSTYVDKFLENTISMGIFGFVVVLFTSMMFFSEYEYVVNRILNTKDPRSFWEKLSSYWTLITLAPLGLGVSFYFSNYVQNLLNSFEYTSWINFLAIVPYLIIWALFFATYMISASTSLQPKVVLLASFISSLIWYICKTLFVYYVVYNKTYLSIYGSFSIAIFFLIWIYISWVIFLFGVKLCRVLRQKNNKSQQNTKDSQIPIENRNDT